jgi:hypothetical protein
MIKKAITSAKTVAAAAVTVLKDSTKSSNEYVKRMLMDLVGVDDVSNEKLTKARRKIPRIPMPLFFSLPRLSWLSSSQPVHLLTDICAGDLETIAGIAEPGPFGFVPSNTDVVSAFYRALFTSEARPRFLVH